MSHSTTDFLSPAAAAKLKAMLERETARSREPMHIRDRAEFGRFFDGMDLVPPGIVALTDWHSDLPPAERPSPSDVSIYGAVARIS